MTMCPSLPAVLGEMSAKIIRVGEAGDIGVGRGKGVWCGEEAGEGKKGSGAGGLLHVGEDWNRLWEVVKGFGELMGRNV